ncbi:MAG: thiolase domain-containing protein [Thermoplasmata archaeon]|nr:MAG: thiolase domain-containing protein [Thermoplasmata archaeon]
MRDVAVIGIGLTKFGELWDRSFRELGIEAGLEAIEDSGIAGKDIGALYIGNMSAGRLIAQEHIAPMVSEQVGLTLGNIPATRVEAASASGGLAFRQGFIDVASGLHDIVVVGGAEKMSDVGPEVITETLASGADQEWEAFFGATIPSLFAMMARRHMVEFGTTVEQLAAVAVKNHKHGSLNPKAQFQGEINMDVALKAPFVAEPLRMFDCAPVSDGAAAVVLCALERAKDYTNQPIKISGTGQATDTFALHDRKSLTTMAATKAAAARAFKMAGKKPGDIDVIEVHDSYTIAEIMAIEDLGIVDKGKGGPAVEEGLTALEGEFPVNTSGGLKARGHPHGATGVAQVVEIVAQLKGIADKRQVKDAKVGLTHNIGGTGGTAVVHILEAV